MTCIATLTKKWSYIGNKAPCALFLLGHVEMDGVYVSGPPCLSSVSKVIISGVYQIASPPQLNIPGNFFGPVMD
jgi:hypothetical protein